MGLEPTTSTLRVRSATHCATTPLEIDDDYTCAVLTEIRGFEKMNKYVERGKLDKRTGSPSLNKVFELN